MNLKLPVEKNVTEIYFVHPVNGHGKALCTQWDTAREGTFISFKKVVPTEGEIYTVGDEYLVPLTNVAAIVDSYETKKIMRRSGK